MHAQQRSTLADAPCVRPDGSSVTVKLGENCDVFVNPFPVHGASDEIVAECFPITWHTERQISTLFEIKLFVHSIV